MTKEKLAEMTEQIALLMERSSRAVSVEDSVVLSTAAMNLANAISVLVIAKNEFTRFDDEE